MTKYKDGPNGYALYFHKGLWKESASVKNEDVERLNKGNNMAHYDEQREAEAGSDLELDWALNLKFTKINPDESGQVITPFKGGFIILDFDINNGGEFYKWNEGTGVMQKAIKPKLFAVLPVIFGDYR